MTVRSFPQVRYDLIKLKGGLDQVTPTLSLQSGACTACDNFEVSIFGGYTRIRGYERFDGRTNPSDGNFVILNVALTVTPMSGDVVTGGTSGAFGTVIFVKPDTLVLAKTTGDFAPSEVLRSASVPIGATVGETATTTTAEDFAYYSALSADLYRKDIFAVPGSGPVRGVIFYKNTVYALRDNANGTVGAIYRSTLTGWSLVPLGFQLGFSAGSVRVAEGKTVRGATSGATGVVARVALETGAYMGATAVGTFILSATTGTFTVGENLTVDGVVVAKTTTSALAITRSPGGKLETSSGNFSGQGATERVYGADGVNPAFEFDGVVYVPIKLSVTPNAPAHISVHANSLFLSQGGSFFYSVLGTPYSFDPLLFAGEVAVGADITALKVLPGSQQTGTLGVYTQSSTSILYGKSYLDFNFVSFNTGAGAYPYTVQNLETSYTFENRGLVKLTTSQAYGNFDSAALTLNIPKFIRQQRALTSCSGLNRAKSQYRIFFSDGRGLYCSFINGEFAGSAPVTFPDPVNVLCEGPDDTSFFGSTNGFVYRLDVGTSFDGQEIEAFLTLNFNSVGNSRTLKRYRKGVMEIQGEGFSGFSFAYDLSYSSTDLEQQLATSQSVQSFDPAYWDLFKWDNFFFDAAAVLPAEFEMTGTGENFSIRIYSSSNYYGSFTLNSFICHYTPRRGLR